MNEAPEHVMPEELRELTDVALDDADNLLQSWIEGERQLLALLRTYTAGVRSGADQVADATMRMVSANIETTFAYAHKLSQARDMAEVIRLQVEFCTEQSRNAARQIQTLGATLMQAGELAT